jgi:uncharacterized protein YjhX (UPF0386 family)
MNISRGEQRVLHVLAKGGYIRHYFDARGRIHLVECYTHDGLVLADCDLALFGKLRRRRPIESFSSSPLSHSAARARGGAAATRQSLTEGGRMHPAAAVLTQDEHMRT